MRAIGTRRGTLATLAFILLAGMTIAAFAQDAAPSGSDNPQPAGQPVIQVDNAEHDFGSVWAGPKLTHTFKITNAGTAPLKILSIKLTCDCTEAAKTPESLAPGETGDFPFVLDTKKVRNVYRRTILILSNDPVTPTLQLAVKGESKQRIKIEPAGAYFGILSGSEPQTRVIRITNNMDAPLKLTFGGLPANAQFAFELQETTPGKQYELRVATVPPYTPGELQALIGLRTNLAEEPAISIRAYARVPDRVDVVPTMILVPKTEAEDKGHTTLMRLTNYGTPPVKLVEVVTPNPAITSTIIENEANKQYTVRVEFPAGYVPPETGAAITLRTDDAEKSTFEIPLKPGATRSQRPVATQPTVRKQRPAM
ncbi:MAG: DUF1573 domain-containing protein, partial [Phycisphaerae bacterium]|nr:DUF1573 domain-containing protein [Phycisphaerae bacterium]